MTNTAQNTTDRIWTIPQPNRDLPHLGYPLLEGVETHTLFRPSIEDGGYNHHPRIRHHGGRFVATWSNHPHGEDGPGQRVLLTEGKTLNAMGAEWRELFSPISEVKQSEECGLVLTSVRLLVAEGRLFGCVGVNENVGFTNAELTSTAPVRSLEHPMRKRKPYSPIVREIREDGSLGPIHALFADNIIPTEKTAYPVAHPDEGDHAAIAAPLKEEFLKDPLLAWDWEGRLNRPSETWLCESVRYTTAKGEVRILSRDELYSHNLYLSLPNKTETGWQTPIQTNIPDAPSLCSTVCTEEGCVILIGNQTSWEQEGVEHFPRDPLTVAVSPDGECFDRAWALVSNPAPHRLEGVIGRGPGPQYPYAILHGNRLIVIYSQGKEDICVAEVELSALGL